MSYCPVFECKLVRQSSVRYSQKANSTSQAIRIANELLADSPCEQFVAILLDTKLVPIGVSVITKGTLDASLVHPRECFRPAIIANASAVICAHNHPSGDCTPSSQDWSVFTRLKTVGEQIGINVLDSVIVDGVGGGLSMVEIGGAQ